MKWIRRNNQIIDTESLDLQCVIPDTEDPLRDAIIELAPEMLAIIFSFVESTEKGKFRPKATFTKMKNLLDKFPKYALEDERMQIQQL